MRVKDLRNSMMSGASSMRSASTRCTLPTVYTWEYRLNVSTGELGWTTLSFREHQCI